jgi:hypothetical protein
MNYSFKESKLYVQKDFTDNTYIIFILLDNTYAHPLTLIGMADYSKQDYDMIDIILNNYNVTKKNINDFNCYSFPDKESAETCIVTLNMLLASS